MSLQFETWKIDRCIDYARNPRKNDHAVDRVAAAIREFGFRVPIVAKSDGTVVDGHLRLKAAKKLGLTEVPVILADDMSEAQIKAFRLSVNKVAELAEWDIDFLKLEIQDLDELGFDLTLTGFDTDELANLLTDPAKGLTDDDAVPEVPAVPVTVEGDVWLLGRHRLMCGDSIDVLAVGKLTAGGKVDMLYCDPPYGMALDTDYSKIKGSAKSPNAKGYKWEKVIGDDVDFDPAPLIELFSETKEQFWWGADYFFECLPRGGSLLVWQKRDKADAQMIGNDFEICWSKQRHKKATFWKRWVGFDSVERGEKRVHPTQKPIDLHCWVLDQWSKVSDTVLDLFGGSGSTLIACEKTDRDCYMMELDPKYCDVIVTRWQEFTGQQATLESTGQAFGELKAERVAA